MSRSSWKSEAPDEFISIKDLIFEGVKIPAIATAIELEGVYTWDRYGRFIKARTGDQDLKEREAQAYVLNCLADCLAKVSQMGIQQPSSCAQLGDIFALHFDWPDDVETCKVLSLYGWIKKALPNFSELYSNFLKEQAGVAVEPKLPIEQPARQSSLRDLIKGLIVLNYGKDVLKELQLSYSKKISEVREELAAKGYSFSQKTLKKYFKDL